MTASFPLTGFEEYMLHDDCVEHPMTFLLRVDLQGAVDQAKLASAFDEVVRRHPIFWSKIVKNGRVSFAWQPDTTQIPSLQVAHHQTTNECPLAGYIDVKTQPGIRAHLNVAAASSTLWLQFHHSCADGTAGIEFLSELLEAYSRHVSQPGAVSSELGSFPQHVCAYASLTRWEKTKRAVRDLHTAANFFCRHLISLTSVLETEKPLGVPTYVEARLPMTPAVRARLKRVHPANTTVNDILLGDVFLALQDTLSDRRRNGRWIRLVVPMNLRKRGAPSTGCRNNMSMVFVDRRVGRIDDKGELLRSFSEQMNQIKRRRTGYA